MKYIFQTLNRDIYKIRQLDKKKYKIKAKNYI